MAKQEVAGEVVDVQTGEVVETQAVAVREPTEDALGAASVVPDMTPARIQAVRDRMEAVKTNLLTKDDYEFIKSGGFSVVKASGYSKVATFCGLSEELISMDITTNDEGAVVKAIAHVRVTHPNGRFIDAFGVCTTQNRRSKDPEHDVPTTAHTRARKRAIGAMVGGINADDEGEDGAPQQQARGQQRQQGRPVQQGRPRQQQRQQQEPHPYAPRGNGHQRR